MANETLQEGMEWVAARATQLAQERGADLTPLGWDANIVDRTANRYMFVVLVNGTRAVVPFDDVALKAVPTNALCQVTVDAQLRFLLNTHLRDTLRRTA